MKIFFSLLAIVILNKECEEKKVADISFGTMNSEKISNAMQEDMRITYEATTRGFYEKIWITKDSISVTQDRSHAQKISNTTSENEWDELMALLKEVDVKTLPNLEAPTAMRLYDGAAIARLSITQNKVETTSDGFDHGHPPKEIEAIVNKVLSMKEKFEKH